MIIIAFVSRCYLMWTDISILDVWITISLILKFEFGINNSSNIIYADGTSTFIDDTFPFESHYHNILEILIRADSSEMLHTFDCIYKFLIVFKLLKIA